MIRQFRLLAFAMVMALLLAAHDSANPNGYGPLVVYPYWLVRGLIEAVLFLAVYQAAGRFLGGRWRGLAALSACLLTLPVFVMATITMDLVLGVPELGLDSGAGETAGRLEGLGLEMFYLLDNHLFFCLLLFLADQVPQREMAGQEALDTVRPDSGPKPEASATGEIPDILKRHLENPLAGRLISVEAQEHYIRLVTGEGAAMMLYRFSDAVQDLADVPGMQVHRSHWVAEKGVENLFREKGQLKIRLTNGEMVPVSRRFEQAVKGRFSDKPFPRD